MSLSVFGYEQNVFPKSFSSSAYPLIFLLCDGASLSSRILLTFSYSSFLTPCNVFFLSFLISPLLTPDCEPSFSPFLLLPPALATRKLHIALTKSLVWRKKYHTLFFIRWHKIKRVRQVAKVYSRHPPGQDGFNATLIFSYRVRTVLTFIGVFILPWGREVFEHLRISRVP